MKGSRIALWVFAMFVAAWLIAPTLVGIPLSFTDKPSLVFPPSGYSTRWYANFFSDAGRVHIGTPSARMRAARMVSPSARA